MMSSGIETKVVLYLCLLIPFGTVCRELFVWMDLHQILEKGKIKLKSSSCNNRVSYGFHLVEGQSGYDMEDYHVAEYRQKKEHMLGFFAIFDGHLGGHVPSYLKDNLFNNILEEVCFNLWMAFFHFFDTLIIISKS